MVLPMDVTTILALLGAYTADLYDHTSYAGYNPWNINADDTGHVKNMNTQSPLVEIRGPNCNGRAVYTIPTFLT